LKAAVNKDFSSAKNHSPSDNQSEEEEEHRHRFFSTFFNFFVPMPHILESNHPTCVGDTGKKGVSLKICSVQSSKFQEHKHYTQNTEYDVAWKETTTTDQQNHKSIGDKVRSKPSQRVRAIKSTEANRCEPVRFQRSSCNSSR
jgi:hypothetical protein